LYGGAGAAKRDAAAERKPKHVLGGAGSGEQGEETHLNSGNWNSQVFLLRMPTVPLVPCCSTFLIKSRIKKKNYKKLESI
jgi:hypothetical protein